MIDVNEAARQIGIPLARWPGNCHAIAIAFIEAGIPPLGGEAVYGHYLGPVAEDSMFSATHRAVGFVRHGWVECPEPAGWVIDPTRYVFEGKLPYVYHGPGDEYDRGGNRFRAATMGPAPAFDPESTDPTYTTLGLDFGSAYLIADLLDDDRRVVSMEQALWLANLPIEMLGGFAMEVYAWLVVCGLDAFIPIDNKRAIFK